ncbi:MAG: AsnC family protein, partial [Candidatus Thorarchaeota archaeon]|nr:AsnC family protein [Candidatus Thorarchaeota archaeon]
MAGNLPKELDKTDMRILELLQANCKMSIAKIAKEVGKG